MTLHIGLCFDQVDFLKKGNSYRQAVLIKYNYVTRDRATLSLMMFLHSVKWLKTTIPSIADIKEPSEGLGILTLRIYIGEEYH